MRPTPSEPSILFVNHDDDCNEHPCSMLWLQGYDVVLAHYLAEGQLELARRPFDLLVCRNAMCDGFGGDLIKLAWEQYRTPSVFLTGVMTATEIAKRILPDALRGVLRIPYTADELITAVRSALPADRTPAHPKDRGDYLSRCPDCQGKGEIVLLVRKEHCRRCSSSGRVIDVLDAPLREVKCIHQHIRFALHRVGIRTLREVARMDGEQLLTVPMLTLARAASLKHDVHILQALQEGSRA